MICDVHEGLWNNIMFYHYNLIDRIRWSKMFLSFLSFSFLDTNTFGKTRFWNLVNFFIYCLSFISTSLISRSIMILNSYARLKFRPFSLFNFISSQIYFRKCEKLIDMCKKIFSTFSWDNTWSSLFSPNKSLNASTCDLKIFLSILKFFLLTWPTLRFSTSDQLAFSK